MFNRHKFGFDKYYEPLENGKYKTIADYFYTEFITAYCEDKGIEIKKMQINNRRIELKVKCNKSTFYKMISNFTLHFKNSISNIWY